MSLPQIKRINRLATYLSFIATLFSLVFWNMRITLGVAIGSLIGTVNFYALHRILRAIFTSGNPRKQILLATLIVFKFSILAISIYLIIRFIPVNSIALIVGISVVVLSIFVEGFCSTLRSTTHQSE